MAPERVVLSFKIDSLLNCAVSHLIREPLSVTGVFKSQAAQAGNQVFLLVRVCIW